MDMDVDDVLEFLADAVLDAEADVVGLGNAEVRIDTDLGIDIAHSAHGAAAQAVHGDYPVHGEDFLAHLLHQLRIEAGVDQFREGLADQVQTHDRDHHRDGDGGQGVHVLVAGDLGGDTDYDHDGREHIGAMVQRVAFEQGGLDLARRAHGIAVEEFLADDGQCGKGDGVGLGLVARAGDDGLIAAPGHAGSHGDQGETEEDRDQGLDAAVTIGMILVGVLGGVMSGDQYHEIADQVGQRVQAVGDQSLGLGQQPRNDLSQGQEYIDEYADPGDAVDDALASLIRRFCGRWCHGFSHR